MSKTFISSKPIKILYEDDHYIAFFKPPGLLSVPTDKMMRGKIDQTLEQIVNVQYAARPGVAEGVKLHPCHRLDRDTSGVIIFAKGHRAEELMMEFFRQKFVQKKYIAFVQGKLERKQGEIRSRLQEDKSSKDPDQVSVTRYTLKEQRREFAVVEVVPLTGRTNQIRIHFKEIGHPLVGENKFVFRKDFDLRFKRTALHAWELYFKSPMTGNPISITAPLALDMQNFLERNPK